jgi:hypothetical protein
MKKKHIKILKKPNWSVYKFEIKKTEPNPNKKNPSQIGLNRFLSKKTLTNRFRFFFLKFGLVIFLYKNRTEQKMITPQFIRH